MPSITLISIFISCFVVLFTCYYQRYDRVRKTRSRAAAAQDCNEDILRLIFEHCSDATLATAARVCVAWSVPAQMELFSSIPTERLPRHFPRWDELTEVLEKNPRLRSYIRCLRIYTATSAALQHYRWVPLVPLGSIISMDVGTSPKREMYAALSGMIMPTCALRSLRRLIIDAPILGGTAGLDACLSNASLEHLGIIFLRASALPSIRAFAALSVD
ncbi:hypothetical protein C8R46DRAFT_1297664 [Mycena filopes]|nr:hypothetical protein C8R46DRAFT_1297664 [Mycena filopes]